MRKIFAALLLILAIGLPSRATDFGLGLDLTDGQWSFAVTSRPDFSIGKFGVGLDVFLRFNNEGIIKEDWENPRRVFANVVRYVRWGYKGEPFYTRVGVLEQATLGAGGLMYRYTNLTQAEAQTFGKRRLGLELDVELPQGGVEAVCNDLMAPALYGGRIYVKPFSLSGLDLGLLNALQLGLTRVGDKRYHNRVASGIDTILPVHPLILGYAQIMTLKDDQQAYGKGYSFGITNRVSRVFNYRAELRRFDPGFVPSLFNALYEDQAGLIPAFNPNDPATTGFLVSAGLELWQRNVLLETAYTRNFGDHAKAPTLSASLQIKEEFLSGLLGRRAALEASFIQTEFTGFANLRNENARVQTKLTIEAFKNVLLTYDRSLTFNAQGEALGQTKYSVNYVFSL